MNLSRLVLSYIKIIFRWGYLGNYPLNWDRMKRLWKVNKEIQRIKRYICENQH